MPKTVKNEAYCFKCKEKVKIDDPERTEFKNGKPALKGKCSNGCGTTVTRLLPQKE